MASRARLSVPQQNRTVSMQAIVEYILETCTVIITYLSFPQMEEKFSKIRESELGSIKDLLACLCLHGAVVSSLSLTLWVRDLTLLQKYLTNFVNSTEFHFGKNRVFFLCSHKIHRTWYLIYFISKGTFHDYKSYRTFPMESRLVL